MEELIHWFNVNNRDLPWRYTRDPYLIWISEVILQQTRVDQGIGYYHRFISRFPTIKELADADIDEILMLWQGLGYYTRARNLHETAKIVQSKYKGKFPDEVSDLKGLKGIGDYTAAAIASLAFNKPEAMVDGNVYRVLSRYFASEIPIDSTSGKKHFKELAQAVLNTKNPAAHNEALMELGATVCLPANPICTHCPLQLKCMSLAQKNTFSYPVKSRKLKQRVRYLYFVVMHYKENTYIEKRQNTDIWKGLYQFPLVESEAQVQPEEFSDFLQKTIFKTFSAYKIRVISSEFKHILSHQVLQGCFVHVDLEEEWSKSGSIFVQPADLAKFAMPRLITRYLEQAMD
ncbi:MAG: A/G-specific adenine glycosylase [Bacteroidota bacterium]|nr:MAG: A/G-specific adenine glycosylase [Bacteroidota bacterium]